MATEIWVNIGPGNGLLPDGTKPLPEPMLTCHKYGPVTFIWGQFHKRYLSHWPLNQLENYSSKIYFESPRGQWVNCSSVAASATNVFPLPGSTLPHCVSLYWPPQNGVHCPSGPSNSGLSHVLHEPRSDETSCVQPFCPCKRSSSSYM